ADDAEAEAPAQRQQNEQLGKLGDRAKERRQHEAGQEDRKAGEQQDAGQRRDDDDDVGTGEARLYGEEDDGPDVLKDQQAQAQAAVLGVDLVARRESLRHQERR